MTLLETDTDLDDLKTSIAHLPPLERLPILFPDVAEEILSLSEGEIARLCWLLEARPDQLTPSGLDWLVWYVQAGRGWGKTRVGAEDASDWLQHHPKGRLAIIAPTMSSGKNVCVEGESGLLSVLPSSFVDKWNRSEGMLICSNGAHVQVYSSEEPERLRGPQHHRAWCDELAAWKYLQATWDMMTFGLRLPWGDEPPRAIVTTTPKPLGLLRGLRDRQTTIVTRGSTFDNAANLSTPVLEELERRYAGTSLGRQELAGELLEDTEGAMWTRALVEEMRLNADVMDEIDLDSALKIEVAVDPAVTSNETSDLTGIAILVTLADCPCGHASKELPHVLLVEDVSGAYPVAGTDGWPSIVVERHDAWGADRVIAEVNNGGDLVEAVVRTAAQSRGGSAGALAYRSVVASRGKRPRAEPVVGLCEQGRVHLVGLYPELEDEMCEWAGSGKSPDRMDAFVWGVWSAVLSTTSRRGGLR